MLQWTHEQQLVAGPAAAVLPILHRIGAGRCEAPRPHSQLVRPQGLADGATGGVAGACDLFPSERPGP
eukprot:6307663-Alexandrium_andersonii.AAC.1